MVEYYLQSSKPLLCKLFEHCAPAQRSEAPEPCSESHSRLKIVIFRIFMIFILCGVSWWRSSPPEKYCLKCFNLNETWQEPRLNISPAKTFRLLKNKFRDFQKFKKNMVRNTLKSARGPRRSSRGGVLLSEFETSPLQVI